MNFTKLRSRLNKDNLKPTKLLADWSVMRSWWKELRH